MAWYPDAVRKPLTVPNRARNKVRMHKPVRINFHTAVSNSTSIFGFFNSTGAKGVFSHFYVRKDGTVEQYQDTDYTAACDLDGNADTISIETWDGYRTGYPGYWKSDTDVPPWNAAQVEALTKLTRWIVRTHPSIPSRLAKDNRRGTSSYGFSWHRLGVVGAPGFVSRTNAGLTYSLARGKVCPGTRRINQIPAILKAATSEVLSTPSASSNDIEEYIMSMTPEAKQAFVNEIALAVWNMQITAGGKKSVIQAIAESNVKDTAQSAALLGVNSRLSALGDKMGVQPDETAIAQVVIAGISDKVAEATAAAVRAHLGDVEDADVQSIAIAVVDELASRVAA